MFETYNDRAYYGSESLETLQLVHMRWRLYIVHVYIYSSTDLYMYIVVNMLCVCSQFASAVEAEVDSTCSLWSFCITFTNGTKHLMCRETRGYKEVKANMVIKILYMHACTCRRVYSTL